MARDEGKPIDEGRLRTILNSMVEAVYVTDGDGRVTMTNKALDELVEGDVLGRRAKKVIKSKELKSAIRRARRDDEATEVELEAAIGDRVHVFHAQVAPLPRGSGVVTVLHDVTSLKNADRVRRDFVANASHELRTPLTAIRGFAETLLSGAAEDPATRERFLSAIVRNCLRLERLAQDLTLLGRAESPEPSWEATEIDAAAVTRESVLSLEALSKRKEIEVAVHVPPEPVVASLSAHAIDQIVVNLVENAIKYSPERTKVDVTLHRRDDELVWEVLDRGAGIPKEHQRRIFERFYRVDPGRSREEGGTGLGLSIVRNLVRRHGGRIDLESEVGQGSVFRVSLPIPEAD